MQQGRLYAGTSGWSYPHWAKGRFYPKGLKQGEWLNFYARHFPTVEVNMTFYRLPRTNLLERWAGATGEDFVFAVKMWRRITHDKRLADCGDLLDRFLRALEPLNAKAGPLLVQLPPSFHANTETLREFLDLLPRPARRSWLPVFEFRHSSWLSGEISELLDERQAAICLADFPECPVTEPGNFPAVYIRRHGPRGNYRGDYPAADIEKDARRIRQWLDTGRDVYVYFNNDIDGYAVDNARQLIDAVESGDGQ